MNSEPIPPVGGTPNRTSLIALVLLVAVAIGVLAFFVFGADDEGGESAANSVASIDSMVTDSTPDDTVDTVFTVDTVSSDVSTPSSAPADTEVATTSPSLGYSLFDYSFFDVPEMGITDLRGSGCGSGLEGDPVQGDSLPDGLWFGSLGPKYEYYEPIDETDLGYAYKRFDGATLEIDLWCVYSGATAEQKYLSEECQAEIECEANNSTGWLTIDDDDQLREVPVDENFQYRVDFYEAEAGWFCGMTDPFAVGAAWRDSPVWIAVNDGLVTEIFGHCAYWLESSASR